VQLIVFLLMYVFMIFLCLLLSQDSCVLASEGLLKYYETGELPLVPKPAMDSQQEGTFSSEDGENIVASEVKLWCWPL
jgi:hypothetical protein